MPLQSSCKYPTRQVLPPEQTVCEGQLVELDLGVKVWPLPCIQWQFKSKDSPWTNIRQGTNPILSFTARSSDDGNKYRALVQGKCDQWVTNVFELTVNYIEITLNPVSTLSPVGSEVVFTASAVGKPPITGVQWQVSTDNGQTWTNLPNEETTTLTLTNVQASQSGYLYRAVFVNSGCYGFTGYPGSTGHPRFSESNCVACNQATNPAQLTVGEYYAYITNSNNNSSLSVVRLSDATSVNIPQGDGQFDQPLSLAITPDTRYAYIPNVSSDTVSVIRTSNNTLSAYLTVPDFEGPVAIVISPNGQYAYIVSNAGGVVYVIRISDNTLAHTIPGFTAPTAIAISPNGQYIYVINDGDQSLSVIRTSDYVQVVNIDQVEGHFDNPQDVAATSRYFYVTNGFGTVSVFRTSDNSYVTTINIPTEIGPIEITPNGRYAYVAGDSLITVIQVSTNTVVEEITQAEGQFTSIRSMAFTPDGKYLYLTDISANDVRVIDVSTGLWVQTITTAEGQFNNPFAIAITTRP